MLLHIPDVLTADEVLTVRERLREARWADGKITAGYQSAVAKDNGQVQEDDPVAIALGEAIQDRLLANTTFFAGALPLRIYPPLFNRYGGGQSFGFHVDNAVRYDRRETPATPVRTDLSATLFLADPDSYDGGELIIEDTYGSHSVKLPAGHLVLYPGTSLHRVEPVTRGERLASFFWIQSMVRDEAQRRLLFDLDVSIQELTVAAPDDEALVRLTGVYHNLLRRWAET